MNFAFQDKDHLYMVLDYSKGGDLRYQLIQNGAFSEEQTSNIFNLYINKI
jgi:serine/threonine protein kinase